MGSSPAKIDRRRVRAVYAGNSCLPPTVRRQPHMLVPSTMIGFMNNGLLVVFLCGEALNFIMISG